MKKQILLLTFFTSAIILAGSSKAFAQLDPGQTPDPLSCVAGSYPLHPYPGQSYTYSMDGSSGAEQVDQWTWFATKDPNFITGGVLNTGSALTTASGDLLAVGASYGTTSGTNSVDITWSPDILANTVYQGAPGEPTFVVGYGTGVNCADNIQVYEINPKFNFVVDIANIEPATNATLAWDATTEQCVDFVQSAAYNDGTKELDMDYGKDTLYFEVAAASFVNDWTPTFHLNSGLVGVQTAEIGVASSLANAQSGTFIAGMTASWDASTVGTDWAPGVALTANTPADAVTGVSAFVRVIISNLTEESLTDNIFSLAVDAIDNGGAGIWDMENDDCDTATATDAPDQVDYAEHTVTPRPTIIMDPAMPDAAPAPDDVVPKTP